MMMLVVIFVALVGASSADSNVLECTQGCNWYSHTRNWSLGRYPRTGDRSIIRANTVFMDNAPAYMVGASQGGEVFVESDAVIQIKDDVDFIVGPQKNAPQNCVVGQFSAWGDCTKKCGTGLQSRSRTLTAPRFGGDVCPHARETQQCNTQTCSCSTGSGIKQHGAQYGGHGKHFCNRCRCHFGKEHCDQRQCVHNTDRAVCDKTKCVYGPRFNDGDVMTFAAATRKYGAQKSWTNVEFSTVILHHSNDKNGKQFSCGHRRNTLDKCVCYCSNTGPKHIWHHAARHAAEIQSGLTAAGCQCQANWRHEGNTYNGCQNPEDAGVPSSWKDGHGQKHSKWCKIQSSSCMQNRVPAGNDWDTCEGHSTFKMKVLD